MWLNKEWLTGVESQKAMVMTMPKASMYLSRLQHLKNGTSITPQSPLWRIDLTSNTNLHQSTNQINSQRKVHLIMWGSVPLMTMNMAIKTVLHFAEVMHIPHESGPSWIVGYSLYIWAPLHTSGVCTRTSLQDCSMVSLSLQCTRWGFTEGVNLDHQGPPLASCGSQESPLLYPLVPNQTDRKSFHSICTTGWYAKTRFYHILHQVVPI
jgi:hypothetical protein